MKHENSAQAKYDRLLQLILAGTAMLMLFVMSMARLCWSHRLITTLAESWCQIRSNLNCSTHPPHRHVLCCEHSVVALEKIDQVHCEVPFKRAFGMCYLSSSTRCTTHLPVIYAAIRRFFMPWMAQLHLCVSFKRGDHAQSL